MKILFVCTGNTCRSPMAEAYFNSLHLKGFSAESAGLSVPFPDFASPNAVDILKESGIDLNTHRSRQITKQMIDSAEKIVCLTSRHAQALLSAGVSKDKILIPKHDICDPYGGDISVYEYCFNEIKQMVKEILPSLGVYYLKEFIEEDATCVAALEKECFCEPWSVESLLSSYNSGTYFAVCKISDETVGYGGVSIVSKEAYITNIAVRKKYRGIGLGKKITEELINKAKSMGCEFISLEVRNSNIPAISLYSDCGFSVVGKRKNFYRNPSEDAIIMTKTF